MREREHHFQKERDQIRQARAQKSRRKFAARFPREKRTVRIVQRPYSKVQPYSRG